MSTVPHYAPAGALPVDRIADALLSGSATVDRHGRPYAGSGILVALAPEHGRTLNALGVHRRRNVAEWVALVAPVVTGRTAGLYFGSWRDDATGTLCLDVTEAFSDAEEAEALAAARFRGQLAVWHAGRRECIGTTDA